VTEVAVRWERAPRFGHPEVFAAIAALSFLAARFLPLLSLPFVCPMRGLAGIPCATCGMTHAFVHLAHGELAQAIAASPLGAALALAAWLYAALDLSRAALGAPLPVPSRPLARGAVALGLLALLGNWAYLVVREIG
jgi:hypothetical protein